MGKNLVLLGALVKGLRALWFRCQEYYVDGAPSCSVLREVLVTLEILPLLLLGFKTFFYTCTGFP
jgi:hypothetical protein